MNAQPVKIRAIGSKSEKGRSLERITGAIWGQLGYRDIAYNAHATGEEIDVSGTHVVSGEILKGQCKAHADKIDTADVRQFFGDVEKARGSNPRVSGIFISLSGYSATAKKWHEELNEIQKGYFKLKEAKDLLAVLKEAQFIIAPDELLEKMRGVSKLEVTELSIVLTERGPFHEVTFGDSDSKSAYFCILDGFGNHPRTEDLDYVLQRISPTNAGTKQITLKGRESVISSLLQSQSLSLAELSQKALESSADISASVSSLELEGLVTVSSGSVSLREEIDALISIAKMCLNSALESIFLISPYYTNSLTKLLLPFIEAKFCVNFATDEIPAVLSIFRLSPSALRFAVMGNAERFRNTAEHISKLNKTPEEVAEIQKNARESLIEDLARALIIDREEGRLRKILQFYKVVLVKSSLGIKIATREHLLLHTSFNHYTQFAKAEPGVSIKIGQLISVSGPGPLLEGADALFAMNEHEKAISAYDAIIKEWPDSDGALAAQNNKGLVLMTMNRLNEAAELYNALFSKPYCRKEALVNLARVYARLKNDAKMNEVLNLVKKEFASDPLLTGLEAELKMLFELPPATSQSIDGDPKATWPISDLELQ